MLAQSESCGEQGQGDSANHCDSGGAVGGVRGRDGQGVVTLGDVRRHNCCPSGRRIVGVVVRNVHCSHVRVVGRLVSGLSSF